MLYISTDYVFDGRNPPYQHDSSTNPLNDYGIFKLEGEKVVLDQNEGKVGLHSPEIKGLFLTYYSRTRTRYFVYLVRWRGQLMSALAGHCLPY